LGKKPVSGGRPPNERNIIIIRSKLIKEILLNCFGDFREWLDENRRKIGVVKMQYIRK
jgi:hypothetical protein